MFNVAISCGQQGVRQIMDSFRFEEECYVLSKDTSEKLILKFLQKYLQQEERKEIRIRFMASGSGQTRFFQMEEVSFIEVQDHRLCIHAESGSFECRGSLTGIEERLSSLGFMRIHHSYLISLRHIQTAMPKSVRMDDQGHKEILIGRKYLAKYREMLKNIDAYRLN